MKRFVPWVIAGAALVAIVVAISKAQPRQPSSPVNPQPSPQASAPAAPPAPPVAGEVPVGEGERVVHTFADDAALQEFGRVWQERQNRLLRLRVLEGYWNSEQDTLVELSGQVASQYGLDPQKDYALDRERRALVERPAPAGTATEPPAAGETPPSPPAPPAPQEGQVAHTFASDEELQAFDVLWRRRQDVAVRMAVLKSFWDQESGDLSRVNTQLATTYQVDVAKQYTLDTARRVLIEQELPPPSAPPAGAGSAPVAPSPAPQAP